MTIKITNPDAARRAIEWFKANPDKIISGVLARNDDGDAVCTLDPTATCFCLVGRIAHEAGVNTRITDLGLDTFTERGIQRDAIWMTNDDGVKLNRPLTGALFLERILNAQD